MRGTAAVLDGIGYSRGGQLPFDLLDATANSDAEAAERQTDANSQRIIAQSLAEAREARG